MSWCTIHRFFLSFLALLPSACSGGEILARSGSEPAALPSLSEPAPPSAPQASPPSASSPPDPADGGLRAARRSFVTRLFVKGPAPQEYRDEQPPPGVQEVRYRSGDLELKGWLSGPPSSAPPSGQERRPAVVYLHGGFSFSASDWADARPFAEAGFVLFMPMLRGENGNPGFYESFYGEVDDAVAAGDYVKSLPYVDGDRIFIVGHSVGGVLAVLTSMVPSVYKEAASFSGYLSMRRFVSSSPDELIPYSRTRPEEIVIRDPHEFVSSLRIPVVLYADLTNQEQAESFAVKAKDAGKPCEIVMVPGDHATMVAPSVSRAIERFRGTLGR